MLTSKNQHTFSEKAEIELDNAICSVAQIAQEISDSSFLDRDTQYYLVEKDLMEELRAAIKVWKDKTEKFLTSLPERIK